jgi:uncharacterized membrane protein
MSKLSRFNRFLISQSFYPILLSTLLAMSIYTVRVLVSNTWIVYFNLVWNLFLAWIPYTFGVLCAASQRIFPGKWWLLTIPSALWLIFFPNAPYIVTDFLHLAPRPGIPLWYDTLLLASFSWTGLFLAIVSLHTMQKIVRTYLGSFFSWIFVAVSLGLCGLGMYLGRFERWNSWDLLYYTKPILKDIAIRFFDPLDNLSFFGFTMLYTAFLLVCYLMFVSIRHPAVND